MTSGGGCPLQARYEKRGGGGGGGSCPLRPDTKSGGVGVCCTLQAQYERRGSCLADKGEVPYIRDNI